MRNNNNNKMQMLFLPVWPYLKRNWFRTLTGGVHQLTDFLKPMNNLDLCESSVENCLGPRFLNCGLQIDFVCLEWVTSVNLGVLKRKNIR